MVHPLEYDFCLARNADYLVFGLLTQGGTPWLYVVDAVGDTELLFAPAVLFDSNWAQVPENWQMRLTNRGNLEFLPAALAKIDHWFEKYIDENSVVLQLVEEEVQRIRHYM